MTIIVQKIEEILKLLEVDSETKKGIIEAAIKRDEQGQKIILTVVTKEMEKILAIKKKQLHELKKFNREKKEYIGEEEDKTKLEELTAKLASL